MNTVNEALGAETEKGYRLWYKEQIGEHESNYVIIDNKGNVQAKIEYSQVGMTPHALGVFHLTMGHEDTDLVTIGRLIREKELVGGKQYVLPPVAGMRTKLFSITADGKESRHVLNALDELPDSFAELERDIIRLFDRLSGAPLRALSMKVALEPTSAIVGDVVRVHFEFICTGKFPVQFRNPVYPLEAGGGVLKINLWRKRVSGDGEYLDYIFTEELSSKEYLLEERKAVPSDEMYLKVEPGGRLSMWTTMQVPKLSPGMYSAEAIYYGKPLPYSEVATKPELVAGEFHAAMKQLMVQGN